MAAKSETRAAVWHKRLGHAPLRTVRKMLADKMEEGLDVNDDELKALGEAHGKSCTRAKQHRRSFPTSRSTTSALMELIHTDVIVMPKILRQGAKYVLTVLDDFSKASFVECIHRKSDVPEVLRKRLRYLEAVSGCTTKIVRSDNGGEYTAASLREYFEHRSSIHQFTAPYTPEQNGKAERLNRTLTETTRVMLFSSKASDDLWDEAIVTASYLRNRRPAKGIPSTPYERLTGVKPDISHLRTFDARAYVKRHDINQLEARCSPGLILGYAAPSKAYRVLLDDGRIVTSTNAVVHEGEIRLDDSGDDREDSVDEEVPGRGDSDRVPPRAAGDEEGPGRGDSDGYPPRSSGDEDVSEVESALSEADDRQGNVAVEAAARRSGRARRPPGEWWSSSANIAKAETEPSTFEEAMKSPETTAWKSAMETELTSMRELEVWSVVPRTVAIKVLPCRWVFKVKRHADGTVERHKARLVA
jgi:transposase InsO family protein